MTGTRRSKSADSSKHGISTSERREGGGKVDFLVSLDDRKTPNKKAGARSTIPGSLGWASIVDGQFLPKRTRQ